MSAFPADAEAAVLIFLFIHEKHMLAQLTAEPLRTAVAQGECCKFRHVKYLTADAS